MQAPETLGKNVNNPQSSEPERSSPLVLVGASARSAAQSLARSDVRCVTIDQYCDVDTLQSAKSSHLAVTTEQLRTILASYPNHRWAACGEWPGMIEAMDSIADADCRSRFLPGCETWHAASAFPLLQSAAAKAGLSTPLTTQQKPERAQDCRLLEKQPAHSGGLGIRWATGDPECSGDDLVHQQWIEGRPYGATFLAAAGQVQLLGVCRTIFGRIGNCPFVYKGSLGPISITLEAERSKLLIAAHWVAVQSGLTGIFNIDFIRSHSGKISLLETNPRWSASSELIERALIESKQIAPSHSLMQLSINAMLDQPVPKFDSVGLTNDHWMKRIVYASRQLVFDHGKTAASVADFGMIHDIPRDGSIIKPQQPICTLIAKVPTNDQAWWGSYRNAVRCIQQIE